jgi:hypothetical protein
MMPKIPIPHRRAEMGSKHREQGSGLPKFLKLGRRVVFHSAHTRKGGGLVDFSNSRAQLSD